MYEGRSSSAWFIQVHEFFLTLGLQTRGSGFTWGFRFVGDIYVIGHDFLKVVFQVPKGQPISMRMANESVQWSEGEFIVIDDSFEHELWHRGSEGIRIVLLIDLWHPAVDEEARKRLPPMPFTTKLDENGVILDVAGDWVAMASKT